MKLYTYPGAIRFWWTEEGGRRVPLQTRRYAAQLGSNSVVVVFDRKPPQPIGEWLGVTVLSRVPITPGDYVLCEGSRSVATLAVSPAINKTATI